MPDSPETAKIIENAHQLNEISQKMCQALDMFEVFPDEYPMTMGDIRGTLRGVRQVIASQTEVINKQTVHTLEINDALDSLEQVVNKLK